MSVHGDHGGSAAKRRRDRRLRMHWWHDELTLQMALAAALHHSRDVGPVTYNAPRSQKTARAEASKNALRSQKTSVAGGHRVLLAVRGRNRGGTRPDRLAGIRPQVRILQRIVEQIVDPVLVVPMLHDVEPQMVEQLVDMLSPLDLPIPEQVIDVPKIVCPTRAARTVLRAPQLAEQLVEVPTIVSYSSSLQRTMEQHVDIPVPGRGGANLWSSRFSPRTECKSVW